MPTQLSEEKYREIYDLFDTVFGLGKVSIDKLITARARTIDDLKNKPKYYDTLKEPTHKYLRYYDDLQERISSEEIVRHREKIEQIINPGNFYKIDIVGSFRRGAEFCGDIDVLFTTASTSNYDSNVNYVGIVTSILQERGYLIEVLKNGKKTMNAIARLKPSSKARRIDLFFSPPELYAFALLAKTGDIHFNKSLRACIKERNSDYSLSELGIRLPDGSTVGDVRRFRTVDNILQYIGIDKRLPNEMVGDIPAGSCEHSFHSPQSKSQSKSRSNSDSRSKNSKTVKKRKSEYYPTPSKPKKRIRLHRHVTPNIDQYSDLSRSTQRSERTESDPKNWNDSYDSDETYLTPSNKDSA
jgi:hypothetical protein